ncbi:MAG: hypothetical protein C0448_02605 [Sphingobacteriaceae bacterium]|nr:hypothetical protein [Sphingobacteriaceae bacterium]
MHRNIVYLFKRFGRRVFQSRTSSSCHPLVGIAAGQDIETMTSKLILTFLIIVALTACSTKTKKPYNSKLCIQYDIGKLTGINLDTTKFTVLVDSIHNTEGAFDLDYTWYVNIRFDNNYFENIKQVIKTSVNYNSVTHEYDKNWTSVDTAKIKGVWHSDSTLFKFVQKPRQFNPEPIYLSVDTLTKTLDLELIHL